MGNWVDDFIRQEESWLADARTRGVPADALAIAEQLLVRLRSAKRTDDARMFTVDQAAQISGMHPETIRRLAREGRFGDRRPGRILLTVEHVHALGTREKSEPDPNQRIIDLFTRRDGK